MEEAADETFQRINTQNRDLVGGITDLIQTICVTVKELRIEISQDPSQSLSQEVGPSEDQLVKLPSTRQH